MSSTMKSLWGGKKINILGRIWVITENQNHFSTCVPEWGCDVGEDSENDAVGAYKGLRSRSHGESFAETLRRASEDGSLPVPPADKTGESLPKGSQSHDVNGDGDGDAEMRTIARFKDAVVTEAVHRVVNAFVENRPDFGWDLCHYEGTFESAEEDAKADRGAEARSTAVLSIKPLRERLGQA